jgi:hypothetical protein
MISAVPARSIRISLTSAALWLVLAPAAWAHLRSGTVAVDYIVGAVPPTAAYTAQMYTSDHGLTLTVKPGHTVVLLGYLGEPVFRLDRQGLWVNLASPTAVAVGLLRKGQLAAGATVRWRLQPGRRSAVWHDARAQRLPPGVSEGRWRVPLLLDGRHTVLEGTLHRFPRPSPWPWAVALACLIAAGIGPVLLRRHDLLRGGAIAFAVLGSAASVLVATSFVLDSNASPGTWIEGLDEIVFIVVGVAILLRASSNVRVAAAIGLGLVAVAVGLSKGAVFFHPIVLAVAPGAVTRLLVILALGAGMAAAALGGAFFAEAQASAPSWRERVESRR